MPEAIFTLSYAPPEQSQNNTAVFSTNIYRRQQQVPAVSLQMLKYPGYETIAARNPSPLVNFHKKLTRN